RRRVSRRPVRSSPTTVATLSPWPPARRAVSIATRAAARGPLAVGDRVVVRPAHVDPTIALHEHLHVAEAVHREAAVIDTWPIDLRGWDPPGTRR
ncbi:MAG: hypothetical protein ACKOOG_06510, partial [Actinomycetota bacterium]